jgi:HEAT repeat protein
MSKKRKGKSSACGMVGAARLAASVNPNNFRFSAPARHVLMMPMRWVAAICLFACVLAWSAEPIVPAQYGWRRDAMYVYRVNIETNEGEYTSSLRGDVVYLCRATNPHGFTLRCYNLATLQRHSKAGRRFPPFGVFQMGWRFFDGRKVGRQMRPPVDVIFRPNGEVISRSGAKVRAFELIEPSRLVLARLSPAEETEWSITEPVRLNYERRLTTSGKGRLVKLEKTLLAGKLSINFQREKNSLRQTLTLETPVAAGQPRVRVKGTGRTSFNDAGIPVRFAWSGNIINHDGARERTVPLAIVWQLLVDAEAERVLRPPPPATRLERRPIAADELKTLLADLRQHFSQSRPKALAQLVLGDPKATPPAQRVEVVAALGNVLRDSDPFLRRDAARALANWGDAKSIPALIAALNDKQMTVRWAAIDALGSLRDPRGMGPVAKHLGSGREIAAAANALQFFGRAIPGLEPHLTRLLENKNIAVRLETCRLLGAFGTGKSAPALADAARDKNAKVAAAATTALKAIRKRP